jgi:hypothetical protein
MPKTGKEADINYRDAALALQRGTGRDAAESPINAYTVNTREMCET